MDDVYPTALFLPPKLYASIKNSISDRTARLSWSALPVKESKLIDRPLVQYSDGSFGPLGEGNG